MWGDRDTNFEVIEIIQRRDNDGLDYGINHGDVKWSNLEYILQIEDLLMKLNVMYKKRGINGNS